MSTEPPVTPAPPGPPTRRSRLPIVGVGLLVLFGCAAVVIVAAVLLLRGRDGDDDSPLAVQPSVAYIMDISPRMSLSAGQDTRLVVARSIFADVVRRSDPELTAGFRVFGQDTVAEACQDTELVVPFAASNHQQIADQLSGLAVGASTESALGEAMISAIRDLSDEGGPQYMVVVTGGADSCNPEAGRLIAEEAQRSGINLQTFVVGFQVPPQESDALRRMVQASGDAAYFEAADGDELRRILDSIQRLIEEAEPLPDDLGRAPVAAPEGEDEQESQPPAAPADALGYDSQTACDHPYFPLRAGAHWDYSYDGLPATWDVTSVTGNLNNATATVVIAVEGFSATYTWDCGADGVFWYQTGVFDFSEFGEGFEVALTSQSGSPIPPPEAFVPGSSWTSAYTMEMSFEAEGIALGITNQVEETYTAGQPEQRSTAAGSLEVIPINMAGTTTTTSFGATVTNTSSGTCWFAIGVGWTGCLTSSAGETSTSELLSYSIP